MLWHLSICTCVEMYTLTLLHFKRAVFTVLVHFLAAVVTSYIDDEGFNMC